MNPLRIAVIGAGNLGKIHARLLAENPAAQLVAIADPSPAAQSNILSQVSVPVVSDFRSVIDQIDAAVVATPTRFHFEVASELLAAGKHTLIEKPVTDSVQDALQLSNLADANNAVVQVGHVEQFNPAFSKALEEIGTPKFIQASRMSGYTFRSIDIGVVYDLMIHDIDLVNSIFSGHVVDTRAIGFSVFGQNEDMAQARLQFSCGAVANLTSSRCSFSPERSMQIFGTDGFSQIDFTNSTVTTIVVPSWIRNREMDFFNLTPDQQSFIRESLFENILKRQQVEVPRTNAILAEHNDWINAIRTGQRPRIDARQGMQAVEIAQGVLESLNTHRWEQRNLAMTGPLASLPQTDRVDQIPEAMQPRMRRAA